MDKIKGRFESLYNVAEEAIKAAKKPLVAKKVARAFESGIDSLEDQRLELEVKLEDIYNRIANGETQLISRAVEMRQELAAYAETMVDFQNFEEEFFPAG